MVNTDRGYWEKQGRSSTVVGVLAVTTSIPSIIAPRKDIEGVPLLAKIFNAEIQPFGGRQVGHIDDVWLLGFEHAEEGLAFAVDIQRRAAEHLRQREIQFHIGIALDTKVSSQHATLSDPGRRAADLAVVAELGGICLGGDVTDLMEGDLKIDCGLLWQSACFARKWPVRVYRVSLDPADAGRITGHHIPLWDEWSDHQGPSAFEGHA